ncbi:MAG: hypothetical protein DWQ10_16760 [Calditrichaeota bacterium]|nr:MAG: hypothetical protein DWQ10_16760 [Calditrichota bacterium]
MPDFANSATKTPKLLDLVCHIIKTLNNSYKTTMAHIKTTKSIELKFDIEYFLSNNSFPNLKSDISSDNNNFTHP